MIEYIHIKGFRSHLDTRIDLSSGMTAVTGKSMDGKTNILRAATWAKDNRPSGSNFRYRYDDIDTVVEIGVDGCIVTHMKSSKPLNEEGHKALYIIQYPDGTKREFSAYGTSVPEEISNLLNISDICFQNQLDPYMLVISSSGKIAETINKITGIDISDKWNKKIRAASKDIKAEMKVLEVDQKRLIVELEPFQGIDEARMAAEEARRIQEQYDKIIFDSNTVLDLVDVIRASEFEINKNKSVLMALRDLMSEYTRIESEIARIEEINQKAAMISRAQKDKDELKSKIDDLKPLLTKCEVLDSQIKMGFKFIGMAQQLKDTQVIVDLFKVDRDQAKEEYITVLTSSGKCYVCGSDLNADELRSRI
jgi:DNA repair protein SbcC/Rad50